MSLRIEQQFNEIERLFEFKNLSVDQVSKRGIDWHLDHSLKVFIGSFGLLIKSNPTEYKPKFKLSKFIIMNSGIIPRGKARAPKPTNNKEKIDETDLQKQFELVKKLLEEVKQLPKDSFFKHPYFGDLNRDTSLKFLGIHTHHHLKIIRDIKKASASS